MRHALSLKRLFLLLALAGLALAALFFVALREVRQAQEQLISVHEKRYRSYLLADELRQSSDDLTRMARTYVVTGNPEFERQYWAVLAIRNGEQPRPQAYHRIYWDFVAAGEAQPRPPGDTVALRELMRRAGFSEAEFAKLREAQNQSDALVKTETVAMNAVKGRFADASGAFTIQREPDLELARRLMHDADYHAFKAKILRPVDEFFKLLETRTENEVVAAHASINHTYAWLLFVAVVGVVAAMVTLLAVYAWLRHSLGGEPAYAWRVVETIAAGDLAVDIALDPGDRFSLLAAMARMKTNLATMIGEIDRNAAQLTAAAERLAQTAGLVALQNLSQENASHSMAAAVEQMSSSVTEITATMEELSASSTQIADHSQSVVDVANRTLESGRQGAEAMRQLLARMEDISADNRRSLDEIVALGNKSKEIGKIMDLIETVADQTKLIAFNAALEASSAGDAGKRFAVVASEIRRLADSVTESTREIEDKTQEIQDAINRLVITSEKGAHAIATGKEASADTARILEGLVQAAGQTASAARKISFSTQQQKTASAQVVQALHEIAAASAHTAQAVRNISDIGETLLEMSTALRALFRRFRLELATP